MIDYYVVTRTRYNNGQPTTEELVAEGTSLEITGFDESDSEAYSVQSVRLETRSPMSNVVFVNHSGITGVEVEEPLSIIASDGSLRFLCAAPQSNVRIYDMAGNLVVCLDSVEQNTEIDMEFGVYFVVTDQHSTPVKVLVR